MILNIKKLASSQFVKFCIVGGLGAATDMGVLFILHQIFKLQPESFAEHFIWLPGYFLAILQNYLINHYWTFTEHTQSTKVSHKALAKFAITSFISIIPRTGAYELVLFALPSSFIFRGYLANFMGIVAGTIVNFLGSKYIVFKKNG